ncbi:hypothetical protein WAF17_17945 [Bernardetia sp. ABR2-2B]|uniref:hypothetical protein n=1 Tax=Bernardetia sp. ABR2-2B TaxID=3127472 RepID=UPI0030CBA74E
MKAKTIFSVSLWGLIGVFCCSYFFLKEKEEERKGKDEVALDKSERFLVEKIKFKKHVILKTEYFEIEKYGSHPRDVAIYDSLKRNTDFSESLYTTTNYNWDTLKNYLISDFYKYAHIDNQKDKLLLNYQNENSKQLTKLHKLLLYRVHSRYNLTRLHYVGCRLEMRFDPLYLEILPFNSAIVLNYKFYDFDAKPFSSQLYQNKQPIENLYFDVKKDTTLHFQIQTDYYTNDTFGNSKNYKLNIKAGQRNDFEIEELL